MQEENSEGQTLPRINAWVPLPDYYSNILCVKNQSIFFTKPLGCYAMPNQPETSYLKFLIEQIQTS